MKPSNKKQTMPTSPREESILPDGKKSFLVYRNSKYSIVATDNIAFFFVKYQSSIMMCFDRQEYTLNYSLDRIQTQLNERQFFRLNRQCLINIAAVKEVEHYYGRKLLVRLSAAAPDKPLVSKEKVSTFLSWLENR
jgi:two-component system, LytTR family, response regulator LytT